MATDFSDLEALAQQDIDLTPTEAIDPQAFQYQDAPLEEIVDLLRDITEPFALLESSLPTALQQSARKEIEFLTSLCQQRLLEGQQQERFNT
jgi:hypothetical protein